MTILVDIEKGLRKFISRVGVVSDVTCLFLMAYVCVDALIRNISRSFVGSNEFVMNIVIILIFFGIGRTSAYNQQIKIDLLKGFPKVEYFTISLSMITYIVAGIAALKYTMLVFSMSLTTPFLYIPLWPFVAVAGVGMIICGLGSLCVLLRKIAGIEIEEKEEISE